PSSTLQEWADEPRWRQRPQRWHSRCIGGRHRRNRGTRRRHRLPLRDGNPDAAAPSLELGHAATRRYLQPSSRLFSLGTDGHHGLDRRIGLHAEPSETTGHHIGKHRRRHPSTVVGPPARFIDGHGHDDTGVRYRSEAHKGAAVIGLAVLAIHNLARRAALAGYAITLHLRKLGSVRPGRSFENISHLARNLRTEYLLAGGCSFPLDQGKRHHVSVTGEYRIGLRELQQRNR